MSTRELKNGFVMAQLNEHSRIILDDGCYVVQNQDEDGSWGNSPWIHPEAFKALCVLPVPHGALYDCDRDGPLTFNTTKEAHDFAMSLIGEGKHQA
jgi:hypothetical protein